MLCAALVNCLDAPFVVNMDDHPCVTSLLPMTSCHEYSWMRAKDMKEMVRVENIIFMEEFCYLSVYAGETSTWIVIKKYSVFYI